MFFLEEIFAAHVPVQRVNPGLRSPGADSFLLLCFWLEFLRPESLQQILWELSWSSRPCFAVCDTVHLCVLRLPLELFHLQNPRQLLSPGKVLGRTMKARSFASVETTCET